MCLSGLHRSVPLSSEIECYIYIHQPRRCLRDARLVVWHGYAKVLPALADVRKREAAEVVPPEVLREHGKAQPLTEVDAVTVHIRHCHELFGQASRLAGLAAVLSTAALGNRRQVKDARGRVGQIL